MCVIHCINLQRGGSGLSVASSVSLTGNAHSASRMQGFPSDVMCRVPPFQHVLSSGEKGAASFVTPCSAHGEALPAGIFANRLSQLPRSVVGFA